MVPLLGLAVAFLCICDWASCRTARGAKAKLKGLRRLRSPLKAPSKGSGKTSTPEGTLRDLKRDFKAFEGPLRTLRRTRRSSLKVLSKPSAKTP